MSFFWPLGVARAAAITRCSSSASAAFGVCGGGKRVNLGGGVQFYIKYSEYVYTLTTQCTLMVTHGHHASYTHATTPTHPHTLFASASAFCFARRVLPPSAACAAALFAFSAAFCAMRAAFASLAASFSALRRALRASASSSVLAGGGDAGAAAVVDGGTASAAGGGAASAAGDFAAGAASVGDVAAGGACVGAASMGVVSSLTPAAALLPLV